MKKIILIVASMFLTVQIFAVDRLSSNQEIQESKGTALNKFLKLYQEFQDFNEEITQYSLRLMEGVRILIEVHQISSISEVAEKEIEIINLINKKIASFENSENIYIQKILKIKTEYNELMILKCKELSQENATGLQSQTKNEISNKLNMKLEEMKDIHSLIQDDFNKVAGVNKE